jgi:hypothetical protein
MEDCEFAGSSVSCAVVNINDGYIASDIKERRSQAYE